MPILKIPARFFTTVPEDAPRQIDLIVIHTTESELHPRSARAVATWFASPSAPQASAHYIVDAYEVVQCVEESNVAWGAPGGNAKGIQIELVGRAKWIEEWSGENAHGMLERAAELVKCIAERYGIPLRKLDAEDLRFGARGVCGHVDVSRAWKKSDHFDPGQGFPWRSLQIEL